MVWVKFFGLVFRSQESFFDSGCGNCSLTWWPVDLLRPNPQCGTLRWWNRCHGTTPPLPHAVTMHGALVLRAGSQWGEVFQCKPHCKAPFLWLEAHLHLFHLSETLAQSACCCDPVAMENLYILGFLAAFTGRITEENVFAVKKYKYYRKMLIFSLYDDYYQRYARRNHYRALSFIMSPW